MRRAPMVLWGACVALCAAGASGEIIPAGEDLYRAAGEPWVEFGGGSGFTTIPSDTFGPGSDPFDGIIYFGSNPTPDFPGQTDTIVRRLQDVEVEGGGSATVQTEMVELNLVSTEPIKVKYYGGTVQSFFDVYMEVMPPEPPWMGSMTITDGGGGGGGIFTMDPDHGDGLHVNYQFIFVEVEHGARGRGATYTYNPATNPRLTTMAYPGNYQYARPPRACKPGNGFYPVLQEDILLVVDDGMTGSIGLRPCRRGWQPGDPHKMHFPQLPDEQGWDVNATFPNVLADDWGCTESGPVKDIHFWGSWKDMDGDGHGDVGQILFFQLSIHQDIPDPDPSDPTNWSMPGPQVWGAEIWDFDKVPIDPPTLEAWLDPPYDPSMSIPNDHDSYFQYNIDLPPPWFWQQYGQIYWLDVSAVLADPINTQWGWKSTIDHWNDDAVWWNSTGAPPWRPLVEPPRENWYDVVVDMAGNVVSGSGTNAYTDPDTDRQWFFYPQYGWWNIWFYDNPFRTDHYKSGFLNFFVVPVNPLQPSVIQVAVNWSTALWSMEGNPPGERRPPLPGDFTGGVSEDLYIGRWLLPGGPWTIPPGGRQIYEFFEILDYNPEWISVDVQGVNFQIVGPTPRGGLIRHECVQTSMDLAFVITPGPLGACCYLDLQGNLGLCVEVTEGACITQYGGVWQGPNTVCRGMEACCLQGGSCVDADALCCVTQMGGTPQGTGSVCTAPEACCLSDNTCVMADPLCCENELGGTAMGPSSTCGGIQACCLDDNTCVMADAICCLNMLGGIPQGPQSICGGIQACCLDDNTCVMVDALCCVNMLHGVPQGPIAQCSLTGLEACCLPDDTCVMADPLCCVRELGGDPQGPGSACTQPEGCCLFDPSGLFYVCEDLDPLCCANKNGIRQGLGTMCSADTIACCVQGGAQCFDVDPLCCDEMNGVPSTWSQVCLGDADQNGIDDACEPPPTGACCLPDGFCQDLTQAACNGIPNAVFKGVGTWCFGDMNGNGIDDACESPWQPGDPHKMHYPQLPDETGWDVFATEPAVLADDWQCSQSGWVTDVHFWGSWKDDHVGEIQYFVLSIHADIPAEQSPTGYSMPGATLWERPIHNFVATPIDPPTTEGWYNPVTQEIVPNNHGSYFQYDVYLPPNSMEGFWQEEGTVYWLNISAVLYFGGQDAQWGWKSSVDHWNDDAVWASWGTLQWAELYEPYGPILDNYFVLVDPMGMAVGGGSGYNEGSWYYYGNHNWWNQWFYDHPYYPNRWKQGFVQFFVHPLDPQFASWMTFALNYSTPAWSIEGNPPGVPRVPPLPPLTPADEDLYIGRRVLFAGQIPPGGETVMYPFAITEYNPEWVSVDVQGSNFVIDPGPGMGMIQHDCMGSLDLAFVITGGEPKGACCWEDHTCTITTQAECEAVLPSGIWQGPGTACGGMEACCLTDGTCVDADALCCQNVLGGVPGGPFTSCVGDISGCCLDDGTCENHDPVCCVNVELGTPQTENCVGALKPCCFDDGSCRNIDPTCCDDEGGEPSPKGADACLGDENGNDVDDACEPPPDPPTTPTGQPGYKKIRYISFVPANPGVQTALRVTLTDMPAPFNAFDGLQMWVGEAVTKCENAGQTAPPPTGCGAAPGLPLNFRTAYMQCAPYCMNYGAVGALHVTDDEIVPLGVYDVQAIDCSMDFDVEANYSAPLTIRTSKWGDLVKDCTTIPCGPPDGIVNITTDVTAVLDKFKNLPGAVMKSRADIEPNKVEWLVNITDVTKCLDAFLGQTYPPPGFAGPGGCR